METVFGWRGCLNLHFRSGSCPATEHCTPGGSHNRWDHSPQSSLFHYTGYREHLQKSCKVHSWFQDPEISCQISGSRSEGYERPFLSDSLLLHKTLHMYNL
eukprot:sb/3478469/